MVTNLTWLKSIGSFQILSCKHKFQMKVFINMKNKLLGLGNSLQNNSWSSILHSGCLVNVLDWADSWCNQVVKYIFRTSQFICFFFDIYCFYWCITFIWSVWIIVNKIFFNAVTLGRPAFGKWWNHELLQWFISKAVWNTTILHITYISLTLSPTFSVLHL